MKTMLKILHVCFVYFTLSSFSLRLTCAHVLLTYPPARKFSLDATQSQKLGCGQGKGNGPKTTLSAGSTVNITWQSSYAHEGGFKLEMLDPLERPLMDLTPIVLGNKFITLDPRVQNYEVRLPMDFECTDCTIRLLRQASEWDEDFSFVSCADVDVTRNQQENCLERGVFNNELKCVCNKPFEGHRCQYENECVEDEDCGINGHCVDIGGTNYPKKQCYCNAGWFGKYCQKESNLKATEIKLESFNTQELFPEVFLYWRLLLQTDEIEILLVAKSTSYVALGWRPSNITSECKKIPLTKTDQRHPKQLSEIATSPSSVSNEISSTASTTSATTPSKKFPRVRFPSRRPQTLSSLASSTVTKTISTSVQTSSTTSATNPTSSSTNSISSPTNPISSPTNSIPSTNSTFQPTSPPTKSTISTRVVISESMSTSMEVSSSSSESTSMSKEELVGASAEIMSHSVPPSTLSASSDLGHVTVTDVQIKSYTPDGDSRKKRNVKLPLVPLSVLHSMDCMDMVVGSAKGQWGRVRDFYSRDQSTPQPDSFWNGNDDLTAAIAMEVDGVTTIGFRRKLTSTEITDQSITSGLMTLIWAKGQEMDTPKQNSSFYTKDEFKYHGVDRHQRGVATIDFFQEVARETSTKKEKEVKKDELNYHGEWKRPITCSISDCQYRATWKFDPQTDDILFTVFTKNPHSWTGIGFSKDRFMNNTDAIIGWVGEDGKYFMMDMWIKGYSAPILDGVQNIDNQSGVRNESGTTLLFSRKRDTGDELMDLKFEDDQCLYMIFPFNGGEYSPVNKKLKKHESTPAVSSEKICIRSQDVVYTVPATELGTTSEMTITATQVTTVKIETTSLQSPAYTTIFRIFLKEPLRKTLESNSDSVLKALREKIQTDMNAALQNSSGFEGVEVKNLERDATTNDWLLGTMHVLVDKSLEANPNGGAVKKAIAEVVGSGKIGNLEIDKNFLIIEAPKDLEIRDESPPRVDETKSETDEQLIAIYAVIAAVCALGILFFIQIICTIIRYRNARHTRTSKELLITNSGWKDYSTNTSTNYNYEPFMDGDQSNPRKKNPQPEGGTPKNGVAKTSLSKQSPNKFQHPGNDRRSESLPRFTSPHRNSQNSQSGFGGSNTYATHQRGQRESGGVSPARFGRELQPDFYFMPSQRRYTGDVIRVSVDYNNPNYMGKNTK